ncbi:conserved hypothetical protein [Neospora caninum Liverpool]|uniref:Uncharacterized protein n=1 Tax=Neospora caninum (strain Liverpool) TaxID=572307 RepID=F0VBD1_NEOCL|nr:conserved hypothetical protein [Neospora caninum Liverpool]CBZ50915.1 conserved hypothetical protein [Neospora caninum Liverpool]CEL68217.1 TPA: hypothetical protein BN1204_039900 [Neospora caninum Liverpool]|eukprot:XP_003880948.1 conserved hypothetical protein [Neospora caninum Liverpool]
MQSSEITAVESPAIKAALECSPEINPARKTVGVHLPYTGRETHIFSRLGHHTPPGYHYNCTNRPTTAMKIIMADKSYFAKQAGAKVGLLALGFFLCWGPLDQCLLKLRPKQRERREKMASA